MGTLEKIDEAIRGKESPFEKEKRKIYQKKEGIKTDEEIIEEIIEEDKLKDKLQIIYEDLMKILKYYVDMREDYYSLVAIWIMGTYFHKHFETYPYLFINAMRGSAKTRLLKLIACLSYNGEVLASLSEAVLFRTAANRTICLDEFERISGKEKFALRELLNAGYKKGIKVKRMRKIRTKEGENQEVQEFDVFCPIAMANIWGMEEVLGDRCIQLILEKSGVVSVVKLIESFENDKNINDTKKMLNSLVNGVVMPLKQLKKIYTKWNIFIKEKYTPNDNTTPFCEILNDTLNNNTKRQTTPKISIIIPIFTKIDKANINGRHLELFFPLFMIANNISEKLLEEIIIIAKTITQERSTDELMESKDIALIDFVSQQEDTGEFIEIMQLTIQFREYLKEEQEEVKWINTKWLGRALKRLNLIKKKRRLRKGREIILNIENAKKKILIFKQAETEDEPKI